MAEEIVHLPDKRSARTVRAKRKTKAVAKPAVTAARTDEQAPTAPAVPAMEPSGPAMVEERTATTVLAELGSGGTGVERGEVAAEGGSSAFVEPSEQIKAAAKLSPGCWVGYVDPTWTGDGTPPAWALVAEWRSDASGQVVEYQENAEYRPSPLLLDWPEPTDPVDAAVQLAVTGYGPSADVFTALAGADLAVYVGPDGDPLVAVSPDGHSVVPAFTSPSQLDIANRLAFVVLSTTELVGRLGDNTQLYLNSAGPAPLRLDTEPILRAIATAAEQNQATEDTSGTSLAQ